MAATETAESRTGRRGFLMAWVGAGVAWMAAAAYPVLRYLSPRPPPNPFGEEGRALVNGLKASDLADPGQGANAGYGGRSLVIFRDPQGRLRAFDAKCTHAGCNVQFQKDRIHCHCHGGTYDLDGRNVAGPPPRPLTELRVLVEGDRLFVAPMDS